MAEDSSDNSLKSFVERRLTELRINAFEAARRGGLQKDFVHHILIGRKRAIGTDKIGQLAMALEVSPADLTARLYSATLRPTPGASALSAREEGEIYDPNTSRDATLSTIVKSMLDRNPNLSAWAAKSDSLSAAGIKPGDVLLIDQSIPAKPGDTVCAQIEESAGARTVFRLYQPPFLVGAAPDPADIKPEIVDGERVRIAGVMVNLFRRRARN